MISYPPSLKAVGGARTGIAPVNLLDVLTLNNDLYLFSDRLISGVPIAMEGNAAIPAVPPVLPIPAGQGLAWSLPSNGTAGYNAPAGFGTATASGAVLNQYFSGPFVGPAVWAEWNGFTLPAGIPSGAAITGIYPVIIGTVHGPGAAMVWGQSVDAHNTIAFQGNDIGNLAGQSNGNSIGTSLSLLTLGGIGVRFYNTLSMNPNPGDMEITFVGFAIYYDLGSVGSSGEPAIPASGIPPAAYLPWLMGVPQISFHRSLQTDFGSFELQNVSGDTLSRDFEKLMRRATLEGAFFIYRLWQPDAEASWLEVHGTLTVEDVDQGLVKLKGTQLINPAQDDTPMFQYSETCQLQWAGPRCGATGATECKYSYATCQVPERILVALNSFEKNYGESIANVANKTINRRRKI